MSLFRVRDKNFPGKPGRVWAENLTEEDAKQIAAQLCATNKSMTARAVSMDEDAHRVAQPATPKPLPAKLANHPTLVAAKARATGAAASAAAEAQRRADELQKKQAAARALVSIPSVPDIPGDEGTDIDPGDVDDLLDDLDTPVTADDLEHARLAAESDAKTSDGKQT